ncbi:MAG: DUF3486 family protein [Myxococcales bacterium]|jgi:hypothetical protein|nr:DUF3486 family protein [Myxococcales bacterium]
MGIRGLENRLPPEVRERLERRLIELGFSGYASLIDELNEWLAEAGASPTSRSALQRFGARFEERAAALKRSTEIARAIAAEAGDDEGVLNDAVIRLTQQKLFDVVMDLRVDPDEFDLASLAKSIRDLSKASVEQKKHQLQVRAKVEAKLEALKVASKGKKSGLDPETVRRISEEIYGVL